MWMLDAYNNFVVWVMMCQLGELLIVWDSTAVVGVGVDTTIKLKKLWILLLQQFPTTSRHNSLSLSLSL